jgi:hypothetical protein
MPGDYDFTIADVPFYASNLDDFLAYGLPYFASDGRPLPAGPGSFRITVRAIANSGAALSPYTGTPFGNTGTFQQLVSICLNSFANNYLQTFRSYDPRIDEYITVTGRIDYPMLLSSYRGGAASPDVTIKVDSAFVPDELRATYYGGDPTPLDTTPEYIPGDPLPAGDPDLTYGWNIGRWNYGLWGQGEGA